MKRSVLMVGAVLLVAAGCSVELNPDEAVTFRFESTGSEEFLAATADPELIDRVRQELALPPAQRTLHINGAIEPADGDNLDWSWRFAVDAWDLTQISVELCDGRPSMVEEDPDYWFNTVGRFCPWSARVQDEE